MKVLIETKRLELREFLVSDASCFYQLNANPEVLKYTGDLPFSSILEAETFILNYSHYANFGYGRWTVILKSTQQPIGWCGLKFHKEGFVDIGYRFLKQEWGKGFATEAAKACMDYGKIELKLVQPIWGRVAKNNLGSIRVLEKIGMTYFKTENCKGIEDSLYYRYKTLKK